MPRARADPGQQCGERIELGRGRTEPQRFFGGSLAELGFPAPAVEAPARRPHQVGQRHLSQQLLGVAQPGVFRQALGGGRFRGEKR